MVREGALRTRWNKRQADRRADEVGLLRNEWDSLRSAVRGRLLMIATDKGFRAGAMLAHWARLSTGEVQKLVSEVNGTKSGVRQAAMVKSIEATSTASGSWQAGSLRSVRAGVEPPDGTWLSFGGTRRSWIPKKGCW